MSEKREKKVASDRRSSEKRGKERTEILCTKAGGKDVSRKVSGVFRLRFGVPVSESLSTVAAAAAVVKKAAKLADTKNAVMNQAA